MKPVEPSHSSLNRLQWIALLVGLVCAAAAVVGGLAGGINQFYRSYLVAYVDWIGLSLGSLAILMLHFVGGGRWAGTIRRILEAASKTVYLMVPLFIPLLLNLAANYPWADPARLATDPVVQYKSKFLNPTTFLVGSAVIFVIWLILVSFLGRWSRQEEAGDLAARRREARLSGPGLILYFFTVTAAAIAWIMSVDPSWISSIFGLVIASSQVLASMGFALVVLPRMPGFRTGEIDARSLKTKLMRDLGALELTFVVLWAYLSFFQLLIIWGGNIPHEVAWYLVRIQNGWGFVAALLAAVQFALPFLALIPMRVRSNIALLSLIGLVIVIINWVQYFWQIIPAHYPSIHLHWLDIALALAIGGLWVAFFINRLKQRSLEPFWDMPMEPERASEAHL